MSEPPIQTSSEFDAYAAEYDAQLARGISISGEDKNYFARGRVVWPGFVIQLRKRLCCLAHSAVSRVERASPFEVSDHHHPRGMYSRRYLQDDPRRSAKYFVGKCYIYRHRTASIVQPERAPCFYAATAWSSANIPSEAALSSSIHVVCEAIGITLAAVDE